jgi:hypothetical protein
MVMTTPVVLWLTALGIGIAGSIGSFRSGTERRAWPGHPTWNDRATVRMGFYAAGLAVTFAGILVWLAGR